MFLLENLRYTLELEPHAYAHVRGQKIDGILNMYQTNIGVIVMVEMHNLPQKVGNCSGNVFGFHIHSGESCTGNHENPFKNALTHYNPSYCEHPYHAGDLPPLFENNGYALSVFLTNRFKVEEVIGKTVIIHNQIDDFKSQPSGNAGNMIACGEIKNRKL